MDDRLAGQILQRITAIETLINTEATRCPFREDIARMQNGLDRLNRLEDLVTGLRLDLAKSGAVGGGIVGIIVAVLLGVGKAAHWW